MEDFRKAGRRALNRGGGVVYARRSMLAAGA
jgi:hypothetical protein